MEPFLTEVCHEYIKGGNFFMTIPHPFFFVSFFEGSVAKSIFFH